MYYLKNEREQRPLLFLGPQRAGVRELALMVYGAFFFLNELLKILSMHHFFQHFLMQISSNGKNEKNH